MISRKLRESVRQTYDFRCGYCGIQENDIGSELEIDHFQPLIVGGSDGFENLVYCCSACNRNKREYWPADETMRLLHPRRDDLTLHLNETADGYLTALTNRGQIHLQRLRLNRPQLVAARLLHRQRQADSQELTALRAEIERINQYRDKLEAQLQEITEQLTRSNG